MKRLERQNPKVAQEIYNRIGKNSLYNLLLKILSFPLWLVLPPVILRFIGIEGYGVWAFIQVFVNYGWALNSGIDTTITKYTAEYKAREDHQKIAKLFNTFFFVYSLLFIVFCIFVFIFQNWIIDIFMKTDKIPRTEIAFALVLYAAAFAIKSIFKTYPSFFNGLERMDLTNKVEMLSFLCIFIFSILFLFLGWGIKGLAVANAISTLITTVIYMVVCKKVAPYLKLNPFLFSFSIISEVRKFIIYGAIGGVTSMAHFQLNKLIISYFLGLKYLTYYDLGHKLVSAAFGFLCSFISPIMPAASGVYASMGIKKLREVYETTLKYLALMSAPVFLFTSVFANNIIFVWLGLGYEEAAFVLRFLSIAYLILILTGPGASILTGMGIPELPFYGGLLTAVTNVTLSLLLVVKIGLTGIIISEISANTLALLFSFYFFHKKLGSYMKDILRSLKFSFLSSIGILAVLSITVGYLRNNYIKLGTAAVLFSMAYLFMVYKNPAYGKIKDFIRQPLFFFTYRG